MTGRIGAVLAASAALLMPACLGSHVSFLGYSSKLYDESIRTVYVPVFENRVTQAGPVRGLENLLTETVVKQIEKVTPYKVVSDPEAADTELLGAIVVTNKTLVNRNQLNEIREGEMVLRVELVWRDRRTGEILSRPRQATADGPAPALDPKTVAAPVFVQSTGRFIPELGESITTALKRCCDSMAVQIVSMMEHDQLQCQ